MFVTHKNKKVLMVFIEPTPYILDLLEHGFSEWKNKLDVVFLSENVSQSWNLQSFSNSYDIIKSKTILPFLINIFIKRKYQLIHVAGWSCAINLCLIVLSRFFILPVVVESDTSFSSNTAVWKKIVKKVFYPLLFKFPVFFLPGGKRQMKYLNCYGVKSNKMISAQMTVDVTYITKYVNAVDCAERDQLRLQYDVKKNDLVFLFVGRLLEHKGVRELISAIESNQDIRAKLWIVGSGNLADEVELATQRCKKITYLGRVSGDLLWRIYHAADVFVLPSHEEPWGLVINEAMAAGLSIIATENVGCVDDLVLDKHHGIIVQPKNSTGLSQAMNDMLQNSEKRKLMAKNASEHIANWTLQNEARNIINAWKKSGYSHESQCS